MQQPLIDGTTEKLTSPWHPDGHPGEHLSEHPGDAHAAPIGAQHGVAQRHALGQAAGDGGTAPADFVQGKLQCCRYFHAYELPKIDAWLAVVSSRNPVCRDMQDTWF